MSRQPIKISRLDETEKEVTSKDLTRKELLLYIFDDFFRGFYLVGCLFFDGLIIFQIYSYIPDSSALGIFFNLALPKFNIFNYYIWILIVFLEITVAYLEAKGFRKIWPKDSLTLSGTGRNE
ncbi:MAG: hypothetical protein M1304_06215 [Candidatus Thermoplasmatota archaeon]|nr:hypothetical protein [Candidatus Thermoplasmatota archaeon]MCL5881896.1 hypothetical protein [Candidatus Thermoplasmatota archaeon]